MLMVHNGVLLHHITILLDHIHNNVEGVCTIGLKSVCLTKPVLTDVCWEAAMCQAMCCAQIPHLNVTKELSQLDQHTQNAVGQADYSPC